MKTLRMTACALLVCGSLAMHAARAETPATGGGYVDGAMFRALVDETQDIVEVNLEGAILQALAKSKSDDHGDGEAGDLFAKLKSIHAVIGTVKGPASEALAIVKKTDQKLAASGWQRIARISDATSSVTVLTHTVGGRIDGLVVLTFDSEDKELVFANLAGEIDITRLGEIGERLDVPGLDQVPGAR
jgi:hypothetical protein